MPYPFEYNLATSTFLDLLEAVREETALATTNQAFTVLEGVLRAFRRRVDVQESLRFADRLPVALRALYVHDWDVTEPRRPFGDPRGLGDEVRSLRRRHNAAPDTAVPDVARAVRRFVVVPAFDEVLQGLPVGAAEFWAG